MTLFSAFSSEHGQGGSPQPGFPFLLFGNLKLFGSRVFLSRELCGDGWGGGRLVVYRPESDTRWKGGREEN